MDQYDYELNILVDPKPGKTYADTLFCLCKDYIMKNSGKPGKSSCVGCTQLSVPVKGFTEAYIIFIKFKAPPATANKLYNMLNAEGSIITFGIRTNSYGYQYHSRQAEQ